MLNILKIRFEPCKQHSPKMQNGDSYSVRNLYFTFKNLNFLWEWNMLLAFIYWIQFTVTFYIVQFELLPLINIKCNKKQLLTRISCSNNPVFVSDHSSYCRDDPWLSPGSVTSLVTLHTLSSSPSYIIEFIPNRTSTFALKLHIFGPLHWFLRQKK